MGVQWSLSSISSKPIVCSAIESVGYSPVLKCISELPSPFHQFGLLVALASA
jgi:hypothetical protein